MNRSYLIAALAFAGLTAGASSVHAAPGNLHEEGCFAGSSTYFVRDNGVYSSISYRDPRCSTPAAVAAPALPVAPYGGADFGPGFYLTGAIEVARALNQAPPVAPTQNPYLHLATPVPSYTSASRPITQGPVYVVSGVLPTFRPPSTGTAGLR